MNYIKAVKTEALKDKEFISVTLLGKKVGIFKKDEEIYAIETGCKHQGADITKGMKKGDVFTCPRHGWKYNIYTGACISHKSPSLRRYPIKIEGEYIKISLTPVEDNDY